MDALPYLVAETTTTPTPIWVIVLGVTLALAIVSILFSVCGEGFTWLEKFITKYFWVIYGVALFWYGGTYLAMKNAHDEYGNSYWSYTIMDKDAINNPSGYLISTNDYRSYIPATFDENYEFITHTVYASSELQAKLDRFHASLMPAFGLYWFWVVIGIIRFFTKCDEGAYTPKVRTAGTAPVVVAGAAAGSGLVMEAVGKFIGGTVGRSMAQTGAALQAIGWVVAVFYVIAAGAIMPLIFLAVVAEWVCDKILETRAGQGTHRESAREKMRTDVHPAIAAAERLKRRMAKAARRSNS